jgi:hypothetical protein
LLRHRNVKLSLAAGRGAHLAGCFEDGHAESFRLRFAHRRNPRAGVDKVSGGPSVEGKWNEQAIVVAEHGMTDFRRGLIRQVEKRTERGVIPPNIRPVRKLNQSPLQVRFQAGVLAGLEVKVRQKFIGFLGLLGTRRGLDHRPQKLFRIVPLVECRRDCAAIKRRTLLRVERLAKREPLPRGEQGSQVCRRFRRLWPCGRLTPCRRSGAQREHGHGDEAGVLQQLADGEFEIVHGSLNR